MLEGKQILITGASKGIGRAIAQVCVALGAHVYLNGRDEEALETLAAELGVKAVPLCYDVTDETQVKKAFEHLQKNVGKLDGLVNNAGSMQEAPLAMAKMQDLNTMLQVNTVAAYLHTQLGSRLMSRQRKGCIVNICSIIGQQGAPGLSAYAASKAALTGMTLSTAKELAPIGIRVNGVAPGMIDTDLIAHYDDKRRQDVVAHIGMGRLGKPQEVADLVAFLLADSAAYITGQVIGIDGGMTV